MPLYEYRCKACGATAEIRHGFGENVTSRCEHCGGELQRVFTPAGIVFKGPGFYKTDSRAKTAGAKSDAAAAEAKPDAAAAEAKPDASAAESKSDAAAAKPDTPSAPAAGDGPKNPDGDKPSKKKSGGSGKSEAAA